MSIYLLTGVPGSGKSYFAVTELKKRLKDFVVIANIDGLRFDALSELGTIYDLEDFLKDRTAQEFFSNTFQEEFTKQIQLKHSKPVCYFIDEFHVAVISSTVRLPADLLHFFAYHRHYGIDIFIITQNLSLIHRQLSDLSAYEVRSKKGVVTEMFIYQYRIQGEVFKTEKLKKDKLIFALYTSFLVTSGKQKTSKLFLYAIVLAFFAIGSSVYLISCRGVMPNAEKSLKKNTQTNKKVIASSPEPKTIVQTLSEIIYFSSLSFYRNKLIINSEFGQLTFNDYVLPSDLSRFKIDNQVFIRGSNPTIENSDDNINPVYNSSQPKIDFSKSKVSPNIINSTVPLSHKKP